MTMMIPITMGALYWMALIKFCSGMIVGFLIGLGLREVADWSRRVMRDGEISKEEL